MIAYHPVWIVWGVLLFYICVEDIKYHSFSLWTVVALYALTIWLNPYTVGSMLGYFGALGVIKLLGEMVLKRTYIEWGDVEILALLCSQSTQVPVLLVFSGGMGAVYCKIFNVPGLPFVPAISIAWCLTEAVSCFFLI